MELKKRSEIEAFLNRPGEARVVLLYGPDAGLVRARGARLVRRASERDDDPFDVARIAGSELAASPERLEEELAAYSMLRGRRLVRLRLDGERDAAEPAILEAVRRHLAGELNPACLLIAEVGPLGKTSPLRVQAERAAAAVAIACYPTEGADLTALIRERLAQDRVGLEPEALRRFAARLPADHGVALAEIERIAVFLGPGSGQIASEADLDEFVGVEPDASLAQGAYEAFGGRAAAAYAQIRRAEREGQAGPPAARAMAAHLARLRRVAEARLGGKPVGEAVQSLKIFWKSREEFTRQARAWDLANSEAAQAQIFAAEQACRQTGAPAAMLVERLSFWIASRAKRLGL